MNEKKAKMINSVDKYLNEQKNMIEVKAIQSLVKEIRTMPFLKRLDFALKIILQGNKK